MKKYAFCEAVTAGSNSRWHIRELTELGLKLGGGADTAALCGHAVCWDVRCEVTSSAIGAGNVRCCEMRKKIWRDKNETNVGG